jgi:hypothetical protein
MCIWVRGWSRVRLAGTITSVVQLYVRGMCVCRETGCDQRIWRRLEIVLDLCCPACDDRGCDALVPRAGSKARATCGWRGAAGEP